MGEPVIRKAVTFLFSCLVLVVVGACSPSALPTTASSAQLTPTAETVTSETPDHPGPVVGGTIKGRVTNTVGQPIANAMVKADPKTPGVPLNAIAIVTDSQGYYSILLYLGKYDITFDVQGYKPQIKQAELSTNGQEITLDFVLEPAQ